VKTLITCLFAAVVGSIAVASSAGHYHLLKKVPVPYDTTAWDYCSVDSVNRRVYAAHGTQVEVMDADSGTLVGKIENTPNVHGVAIANELGRGFTSNGISSTSTIFDLKTLKILGEVKLSGEGPDAIVYDPATQRVFTFNKRNNLNSTAIDAKEGKVVGTIELPGTPEFPTADGKGNIFVGLVDKNVVLQIDSRKLTTGASWPLGSCERPGSMAIDRKNDRLFVGCANKVMVIVDSTNGRIVTTLPIGEAKDAAAYDPGTHLAFSSNGEGTLTVIHQESPDKYTVETVKTEFGARTMGVDLKTHKLFLPLADRGPAPAATAENPRPRGDIIPGTFRILIFGM
jgi:DNA-binding beta-propeller fold protein YncE